MVWCSMATVYGRRPFYSWTATCLRYLPHKVCRSHPKTLDILLCNCDTLSEFECVLLHKEPEQKVNIFDPTPPPQRSLKTKVRPFCPNLPQLTCFVQKIDRYLVTSHCLGSGSFATVHLAMDASAFKQVACKCIKRKSNDKVEKIRKEVDILLNISHVSLDFH